MGQLWEKAENSFMTSYKVFASAILDIDVENSRKLFYDVIQYEVIKSAVLDFATSSFCWNGDFILHSGKQRIWYL